MNLLLRNVWTSGHITEGQTAKLEAGPISLNTYARCDRFHQLLGNQKKMLCKVKYCRDCGSTKLSHCVFHRGDEKFQPYSSCSIEASAGIAEGHICLLMIVTIVVEM